MRIALVSTGAELPTLNLAKQLTRMGHEAILVTPADDARGPEAYAYEGAWVRTVEAEQVDRLVKLLREESSDIVHLVDPMRLPHAFDAAEQGRLPVVASVAESADLRDAPAKTLLARAAAVVSPSCETIDRYADAGFDTTRWHHVPSSTGVPPSLEEEAWTLEGIYSDCLVNAAPA